MHVAGRRYDSAMLLWKIDETAGFDTAFASVSDGRLEADGRAAGLRPRMSFNVSPRELHRPDFALELIARLREEGVDPARLTMGSASLPCWC